MPEVQAGDTGYPAGSIEASEAQNRIELGAGYRPTPGFTHQDINPGKHIEIVCDVRDVDQLGDGWDEVRATHLLEHFGRHETTPVLEEWYSILGHKGTLYLEVPNLTGQIAQWQDGSIDDRELVRLMYADQDYEENYHKTAFTVDLLGSYLKDAGFRYVEIRDVGLVLCASGIKSEEGVRP